ncbi:MAG TPA: GNAT family N-acetyltransferase [Tepidisphaeraceae bacterium]|nr:GNAT family N-acetyltransferase [Tepidisphaeraceae bacterium]
MFHVRRASAFEVIDLRHAVLRCGLARATAIFPGDDAPDAVHVVAVEEVGSDILGCATIIPSAWEGQKAWQLRGMAVAPRVQRSGIGGQMLSELRRIAQDTADDVRLMWCNARSPAVAFYERHGWTIASEEFVIPTAGPHFKMILKLPPPDVR